MAMRVIRPVFTEDQGGDLVSMKPAAPPDEAALESLIARHPEVVAEEEGELLLVRRQKGVPDKESGGDRWALDLLFVTRDAIPVLIEVKQATNSELRRQVVAQLLDYAANGTAHWPPGEIQRAFEAHCDALEEEPEAVLGTLVDGRNREGFWRRVDENLAAGRVRLVVAADAIPSELATIVEFLNDQMRADVRAVELGWFESADGRRTLVPRIIGVTERTRAAKSAGKPPISPEQWITEHYGDAPDTASGIRRHLEIAEELGLESGTTRNHQGIWSGRGNRYPIQVYRKNHGIALNVKGNESLRNGLLAAVGALDADNKDWPRFSAERLNDPGARDRYREFLKTFIEEVGLAERT